MSSEKERKIIMKIREISKKYGINKDEFESFIRRSGARFSEGFTGMDIDERQNIEAMVTDFRQYMFAIEQNEAYQKTMIEKAEAEKREALASMLITSGFNFDGFTITKYSGYISGDDAVQIPRGREGLFSSATDVGSSLMESLVTIRRKALAELKEAAYALGCNAVIGVDFDYLTLDPETVNATGGTLYLPYVFGVTANGNAVIIEKNGI